MLIGITGLAGSGKSTVANILQDAHGFERARFADPFKAMLRALGLSDRELEGDGSGEPLEALCGKTSRHAKVTLGTAWGRRMIGADLWVRAWERRVDSLDETDLAAEDVRFPNEAAAIRARGGVIIRIENPRVKPRARWGIVGRLLLALGFRFPIHPSERVDRIEADLILWNGGTLEALEEEVEDILELARDIAANRKPSAVQIAADSLRPDRAARRHAELSESILEAYADRRGLA
ncbi:hypothetical protein [Azospirillum sp. TSH64]|uniref:hypothetical protein n=1 Tax=Azospirillum sp. TSH64 TaxID=652740 RepID=UPI000D64145B|nr:hypothetical protein [Azospirillum sp. TSH64]